MTLGQYLEQFIEGYLIEDLRSMAPIKLAPGKKYGAVGYPMVMTVLSGIEVLGALTSKASFDPENGNARFRDFWVNFMYPNRPARQRLADPVYTLVRHGLAHSFMTKPLIRVTKHRDPAHLCQDIDGVVCLDALILMEEFVGAYEQRLRPVIKGDFESNMQARFQEFRDSYWNEHMARKTDRDKFPLYRQGARPTSQTTGVDEP